MYQKSTKYIPLEPLDESPDSSWGEAAQAKLLESEMEGKGYQQPPNTINETTEEVAPRHPNEPAKAKINKEIFEDTMKFKIIGFVNYEWTEIVVEDDEECESITAEEVKKAIVQLTEREKHNPLYNHTDKYIRVKHKTYVPVEVCKDRNGRMIYTPLKSINKPELSLGVEERANKMSKNANLSIEVTRDDELTEVEYPPCKGCNKKVSFPDTKIKVDIEIIGRNGSRTRALDKQQRIYNACMRKHELLQLINEEIKLDIEQQINVVDMIEQDRTEKSTTLHYRTHTSCPESTT